jgi:integrase
MAKATRRKDGRYVKAITDPRTGKRLYFYGDTERELTLKVLEYTKKNENGRSFGEIAAEWWEEAQPDLAYQSIKTYRPAYRRAVEAFGDTPIKNIRPKDISLFLRKMAKDGKAEKTIANQRMIISLVMDHAILENDIEVNPCTAVQVPKEAKKKMQRKSASEFDETKVKQTYDIWIFPYIAIMTGMRKGEILALQWKDIDFERNVINVTKSVYHEGDRPYIKSPKTEESIRTVPLLAPLKKVLLDKKGNKDDYIVSDDGTKPLTNRRFITLSDNYREKTGVTCTAHQLRHSFATIAFECGLPVKSVQEILGHKQLSTTMDIYTDFRKKSIEEAAELLNEKLSKNI